MFNNTNDDMANSEKSTQAGTKEGEERATFIIKTELLEKIKDVAYWDRLKIKDVVEEAFTSYFKSKGKIKSRPKDQS